MIIKLMQSEKFKRYLLSMNIIFYWYMSKLFKLIKTCLTNIYNINSVQNKLSTIFYLVVYNYNVCNINLLLSQNDSN